MSFSASERTQLAKLLLEVGPDAPTLCGDWTTRDLAIHLYLRESRPDAAVKGHLERVTEQVGRSMTYERVVGEWAKGPARFNPMRLVDPLVNAGEHYVHHEDVRRAQEKWQPRAFGQEDRKALHRVLQTMSRLLLSKTTVPLVLNPEGMDRIVVVEQRGVANPAQSVQVSAANGGPGEASQVQVVVTRPAPGVIGSATGWTLRAEAHARQEGGIDEPEEPGGHSADSGDPG